MSLSHFKELVEKFAESKEIKLQGFEEDHCRDIERKLDAEEISIEDALSELKNRMSKKLGYDDHDYQEIRKTLENSRAGKKE